MKYVSRKELKRLPNGTIFMPVAHHGLLTDGSLRMITGRFNDHSGFNGTIELTPLADGEDLCDEKGRFKLNTNFSVEFETSDETDYDFEPTQIFAVYDDIEIANMIHILTDALIFNSIERRANEEETKE